ENTVFDYHPPARHHGGRRRPLRRDHAGAGRLQDPPPGPEPDAGRAGHYGLIQSPKERNRTLWAFLTKSSRASVRPRPRFPTCSPAFLRLTTISTTSWRRV